MVAGGGVWLSAQLFGGHSEEEKDAKTEQVAPAPVVINLQNNNTNQQKQQGGGTTTIIKEKTIEKQPVAVPDKPKEEDPW